MQGEGKNLKKNFEIFLNVTRSKKTFVELLIMHCKS